MPDYTTICRMIKTLDLQVKNYVRDRTSPMLVAVDSTGISVYNLSG
ncbi:transposase [Candidatus Lariskella endosymbiont of Hedychridium roseum]